ncbi:MAG: radical SAM protein [Candidatus Omnitrophica bacterium]|nr:radical SAM protein [Candidatus Omnitrophota bacterium]
MRPLYLETDLSNLKRKLESLRELLKSCSLCPRNCKVNRLKEQRGFCGAGKDLVVSSFFAHFGEESCLVGRFGSGTIFFSHCNLKCVFCQNFEISHLGEGKTFTPKELSEIMLYLKDNGCHNINLVTPTHFVPQILEALIIAREKGLNLPLVYNCGGYESEKVIDLLEGIIDIYMPDLKFASEEKAQRYASAPDYFSVAKRALKLMYKQVGDLRVINGIAQRGLLIRHLVMPGNLNETKKILEFIAEELSRETFVNIMEQYRPCGLAYRYEEINRPLSLEEYNEALDFARRVELYRFG